MFIILEAIVNLKITVHVILIMGQTVAVQDINARHQIN